MGDRISIWERVIMRRERGGPLQSIGNTAHVRRRCGMLSNYCDHLLLFNQKVDTHFTFPQGWKAELT